MILTTARPSPVRSQRLEVIVAAGNLRADLQARRVGTILKRFHGRLLSRLGAVRALRPGWKLWLSTLGRLALPLPLLGDGASGGDSCFIVMERTALTRQAFQSRCWYS
jgi:hypothetical protein